MLPKNNPQITTLLNLIIVFVIGFLVGQIRSLYLDYNRSKAIYIDQYYRPEVGLVEFKKIEGDELHFTLTGQTRVKWSDNFREILKETDSEIRDFTLPLGQIPNEQDLKLGDFKYLGNAKTNKFYPANSYPARGTEAKYRRFFQTKQAAQKAGFIPSKLVK